MAEQQELDDSATMPLVEHLRELRTRLRNAVAALFVGFVIAYAFKEPLFALLLKPYSEVWLELRGTNEAFGEPTVYFKSLIEPFWVYFTMSIWAGVFIASPFIFHQIWKFVAPGLYQKERHYGIAFALTSAVSFIGGAAFCYFLVLKPVYSFLLGYANANIAQMSGSLLSQELGPAVALLPLPMMEDYMVLARRLIFGFGLIFELPLLIFFLSLVGLVTHRSLWKFNRWWAVLSFVIGAALTPPEIFSQLLMAGPLIVLYNLSILIAYVVTRRRERMAEALDRGEHDPGT
jgi:sec-independent protein translocase protein TatC